MQATNRNYIIALRNDFSTGCDNIYNIHILCIGQDSRNLKIIPFRDILDSYRNSFYCVILFCLIMREDLK